MACNDHTALPTTDPGGLPLLQPSRRHALLMLQTALLQAAVGRPAPASAASLAAATAAAVARGNQLTVEEVALPFMTPPPVLFPRRTLDLTFAVLLLRRRGPAHPCMLPSARPPDLWIFRSTRPLPIIHSGYDAVDELDFMSMQKFQKQVRDVSLVCVSAAAMCRHAAL